MLRTRSMHTANNTEPRLPSREESRGKYPAMHLLCFNLFTTRHVTFYVRDSIQ
jgi:hypothetical protein